MYKGKKVLALIPARGGSKGIPRKNLRSIAGKPLLAWSIEQGLASRRIDRIMVSTEDEEIAAVAKRFGAEVPFMRPTEFAGDTSPVSVAILHAMEQFEKRGENYDVILLIECTSPIRYPGDLDNAIAKLVDNPAAESAVGVVELTHEHPAWTFRVADGFLSNFMKKSGLTAEDCRRQALETTYLPYSFYLSLWSSFQKYKLFYQPKTIPCFLKREQMIEIDDEVDFFMAECMMKKFVIPAWEKGS